MNAWLALEAMDPPARVCLCPTKRTMNLAERIAAYAREKGLAPCEIREIENGPTQNVSLLMRQLGEEAKAAALRVVFNVNGGLNYLIAQCVLDLLPYDPVLIYPASKRTLLYKPENGWNPEAGKMPRGLPIEDVLALQEVEWRHKGKSEFLSIMDHMGLKYPANCLRDVEIRGQTFDLVWNTGNNVLSFFAWCPLPPQINGHNDLIPARKLANWAATRDQSDDLFDRNVLVLTDHTDYQERLERESANKLVAVNIAPKAREDETADPRPSLFQGGLASQKPRPDKWTNAKKQLEKWINYKPPKEESSVPKRPSQAQLDPLEDGTLVVALGNSPDSTLVAIASHKPKRLVLCYQQSLRDIQAMAKVIDGLKGDLGIERVDHVNLEVEGAYCDLLLPEARAGAKIDVNITPGSKAQTAFLTIWAHEKGHTVWSIDNGRRACVPLDNPHNLEPVPVGKVDPLTDLKVLRKNLAEAVCTIEDIKKNSFFPELLAFLRDALASGQADKVLAEAFSLNDRTLEAYIPASRELVFIWKGGQQRIKWNDGLWFEMFTALALHEAGCSDCLARVRPDWIEKRTDKNGQKPFFQDLDVLANFAGNKLVVSCKAHSRWARAKMMDEAHEAKITAQNLHRFALPVLVTFLQEEPEYINGTLVVGWRHICQPELISQQLSEHARMKRTTVR